MNREHGAIAKGFVAHALSGGIHRVALRQLCLNFRLLTLDCALCAAALERMHGDAERLLRRRALELRRFRRGLRLGGQRRLQLG